MRFLKGCGLAVLAVVVLLSLLLWRCNRLVSDADLRAGYWAHRAELEQLRRMVKEDYLYGRVSVTYVDAGAQHLSESRVREYRRLMRECGVRSVQGYGLVDRVAFTVDATGMLDVGTYKGYEWAVEQRRTLARTLDEPCVPAEPRGRHCDAAVPLEGDWWMVREEFR